MLSTLLFAFATGCKCGGGKKISDAGTDAGDAGCVAGEPACACLPGGDCNAGLVCQDGVCTGGELVGVTVSDPDARGCEVLLVEGAATVADVTFDDSVRGTFIREAPRVALSFISSSDAAIVTGSIQVVVSGGSISGLEVRKTECVDRDGAPLSGAEVTLRE